MICKKCGREYEDDMPQCLWCDAPREDEPSQTKLLCEVYKESPEKFVDPKLENALMDNRYRGKSAISWIKISMLLNIILLLAELRTFGPINAGVEGLKVNIPLSNDFWGAMFILISALLFVATPLFVFLWRNWTWIYHAQKLQSLFTESFFAPWGAVTCYYIPIVNYFVFKDLLKSQNQTLTTFGSNAKPVPNKLLNKYLAINIITLICNFLSYTHNYQAPYLLLGVITWFIFLINNIKLIRVPMDNERELHALLYNNAINKKVEEVIAQRETEPQVT